jgi:hypothetical protein
MHKPNFIIICERAFTASGTNNLNLINCFTQVNAVKFPFVHPQFALVVNFDVSHAGKHILRTAVFGPDEKQVAHSELPVQTNAGNWQVIANFEQFRFAGPGTYTFRLHLDDDELGERTLEVKPVLAPARETKNIA